jgi:hypothetical protein
MWGPDYRIIRVPVSPLLAETILDWTKITGEKRENEAALSRGIWWLTVAALKHPLMSSIVLSKFADYCQSEGMTDKAMCRDFVEGRVAFACNESTRLWEGLL